MYGRIYTVRVAPTSCSAIVDFLEIQPATDKPVVIHKVTLTPTLDETNQQMRISVRTLPATLTSGSGGSTPTVGAVNSHDAAAAVTVKAFSTSRATTSGTAVYHAEEGFPSQGGFEYLPDLYERPVIYAGQAFVVSIEEAFSPAQTIGGYAVIEEL